MIKLAKNTIRTRWFHSCAAAKWHARSLVLAVICTYVIWLPALTRPMGTTYDAIIEIQGFREVCTPEQVWSGWPQNENDMASSLGSFAPSLPQYIIQRSACAISSLTQIERRKCYIIIGVLLTCLSAYFSGTALGVDRYAASWSAVAIACAPCSFSRVAHLALSQCWAIPPMIMLSVLLLKDRTCETDTRSTVMSREDLVLGLSVGLMSFTAQEYWCVLNILIVALAFIIGVCWRGNTHTWAKIRNKKLLRMVIGYMVSMALFLASKNLLWNIPESAVEATERTPYEQFLYGFWPIQLFSSPIFNNELAKRFMEAKLPMTETPFGSSGGVLILASYAIAFWSVKRYLETEEKVTGRVESGKLKNSERLTLLFGLVTLLISAFALSFAVAGGLGTAFAIYVTPQLRALNRITPYIYTPAVYTVACWLYSVGLKEYERLRGRG